MQQRLLGSKDGTGLDKGIFHTGHGGVAILHRTGENRTIGDRLIVAVGTQRNCGRRHINHKGDHLHGWVAVGLGVVTGGDSEGIVARRAGVGVDAHLVKGVGELPLAVDDLGGGDHLVGTAADLHGDRGDPGGSVADRAADGQRPLILGVALDPAQRASGQVDTQTW